MQNKSNICGDRIGYDHLENVSNGTTDIYETALWEVENILAIFAEIQNNRKNENGDIAEPLSSQAAGTILEEVPILERSVGILEAVGAFDTTENLLRELNESSEKMLEATEEDR